MNIKEFEEKSVARARDDFGTDKAGGLYYGTALAGELGELLNLVKKIERAKISSKSAAQNTGHTVKAADITKEMMEDEVGGVMAYLILLTHEYGIDLEDATIKTFNTVSKEINSKHFLTTKEEKLKLLQEIMRDYE